MNILTIKKKKSNLTLLNYFNNNNKTQLNIFIKMTYNNYSESLVITFNT